MLKGLTKKDTSSSATAKNKNKNTQPKEEKPAQTRKAYGPRKTSAKDEQKQTKNEKREPKRKREQKNQLNQMIVPKPILRKGEYDHHSMNVGSSGGLASQIVENQKHKSKAKKAGSKKDDQKNNENNDDDGQEYDARGGMGAKRKRGMFARDLRYMMYGFGDVRDPNPESVNLMEDLMVDFVTNIAHQAMGCAERRGGRFSNEDLLYVIRNDEKKLRRVEELMDLNEQIKDAKKNFDLQDPIVVEKVQNQES